MKTIKIRAFGPCSTETYQRDFDGFLVQVRREAFDGWNDLALELPNGKKLPTSSEDFSLVFWVPMILFRSLTQWAT